MAISFTSGQVLRAAELNALVRLATAPADTCAGDTPQTGRPGAGLYMPLNVGGEGRPLTPRDAAASGVDVCAGIKAPGASVASGGRRAAANDTVVVTAPGKLYQIIQTDAYGRPTYTWLSQEGAATPRWWTGEEGGIMCREVGAVVENPHVPRGADNRLTPRSLYIETYNDFQLPVIPVNSERTSGVDSVPLVSSPTGHSVPIKRLVAGSGIALTDGAGAVTISASVTSGVDAAGVQSVEQYTGSPLPEAGVDGWTVTMYQPMTYVNGESSVISYRQLMRVRGTVLQVSHQRAIMPSGSWQSYFSPV